MDDGLIQQGYGFERAQAHAVIAEASYGVTSWLTPSLIVPVGVRAYETVMAQAPRSRSTAGLGDVIVLLKTPIMGRQALAPGAHRLWLAGGLKLPTGRFEDADGIGRLPPSAQLGSGSFDGVLALFDSIGVSGPDGKLSLFTSAVYRHTTANKEGYRFGDDFVGSADLSLAAFERVSLRGGLRVRAAAADRQDGQGLENAGGWLLYARAGAAWHLRTDASISLDLHVPTLSRLEGDQLDPRIQVVLGLVVAPGS
jgi:hypothetical protein